MTTYYKGGVGKEDVQFGTGTFLRKDKDYATVQRTQIHRGHMPRKVVPKTAAYEITTEVGEYTFTNESATGSVTIKLPSAVSGKGPFLFCIIATQTFVIDPQDSDNFRDCVAGKYKSSNIAGNKLKVWCDVAGIWEYDYDLVNGNWDNEV